MSNIAVGSLKGDYIWLDNRLLEMTFQKFDFNDTLGLPVGTGCLQVRKYLALYKRS